MLATLKSFHKYRRLIWEVALRELQVRTKGSVLGIIWIGLVPLIQTLTYVVVIAFVFQVKFKADGTPFEFVIYVLTGQVSWTFAARTLSEAPMLVRAKVDLVKQVVYPIETLPITGIIIGAISGLMALVVAVILAAIDNSLHWSILLLPLPYAIMFIMLLGGSWILMMIGVFFKDITEIVAVAFGVLIFISPVLLTEQIVGPTIWNVMLYNPLAHMVIAFRDVFYGTFHPTSWIVFSSMAALFFIVGQQMVARTRLVINEFI